MRMPMSREMRMAGCPSYGGVPESWIFYDSNSHMCGFHIDKRVCITIMDDEKCNETYIAGSTIPPNPCPEETMYNPKDGLCMWVAPGPSPWEQYGDTNGYGSENNTGSN